MKTFENTLPDGDSAMELLLSTLKTRGARVVAAANAPGFLVNGRFIRERRMLETALALLDSGELTAELERLIG